MGDNRRIGKGRFNAVDGIRAGGTGFAAAGLILALSAEAEAQTELVPTVSNAGVTAAKVAADGTLELTLADGQTLVLAADEFTIAADGTVVLADAAVQEIATLLGIEATNLGLTLVPLAGAGGLGLALAGGGGSTTNTPATVGGTRTGAVTEDSAATLTTTGKLTVTDPDSGEAVFRAATTRGTYGSFTVASDGTWTYSAASAQTAIQQLGAGKTLTDSAVVFTADGTQQTLTVTLTGVNDAAVVSGTLASNVVEDSGEVLRTSGTLTVTDADLGQAGFLPSYQGGQSAGFLGTFNFSANGSWTYEVPNALVQSLGEGVTRTETFTVTTTDGTTQSVAVTITGTNDAPVITGESTGSMEEHGGAGSATGTLTVVDTDAGESVFIAEDSQGVYGTGSIDADGNWTYVLDNPENGVPNLQPGQTAEDRFTVRTADGTEHEVVITITGTPVFNEVSLSATSSVSGTGFVINGIGDLTENGFSVTNVGDVNGDGFDDVLVAQRFTGSLETSFVRSEDSFVVFGKDDGMAVELSDIKNGIGGFAIMGDQPTSGETSTFAAPTSQSLGVKISQLGDVNGDGLADLLVATAQTGGTSYATGTAHVVFGKTDTDAVNLAEVATGVGGFAITDIPVDDLGMRIVGGGDINGDGFADYVVALLTDTPDTPPAGVAAAESDTVVAASDYIQQTKVYVVFGGSDVGVMSLSDIDSGKGGYVISGNTGDGFGASVAIVGDVNGDGKDDIAIGATNGINGDWENGVVHVVFGKSNTDGMTTDNLAENDAGFVIKSSESGSFLGFSVAAAGDINGDGRADILMGSVPGNDLPDRVPSVAAETADASAPDPTTVSMAYVVLGQVQTRDIDLKDATDSAVLKLATPDAYETMTAFSSAGDVDGDGFDDLIIGVYHTYGGAEVRAALADADSAPKEVTYVISGAKLLADKVIILDDRLAGKSGTALIYQAEPLDGHGHAVSGGGDVDGDGFDDLIIGAYKASPNSLYSGATHVVAGGLMTQTTAGVQIGGTDNDILTSTQQGERLIGGAGDDLLDSSDVGAVLIGGAGDDELIIGPETSHVDGGTGWDTMTLGSDSPMLLDLTTIGDTRIQSIEQINLGRNENQLRLDESDVLRLSESTNTLRVTGGGGDQLHLLGPEWRQSDPIRDGGIVYDVYESGNARIEVEKDVLVLRGFTINGRNGVENAGNSVSLVGDVNGDGLDDVVIGALKDNAGGAGSGAAYVVFGKADGLTVELADIANGLGGFRIIGEYTGDLAGTSVSGLGDINGDGFDDILVSAMGYDVDYDGVIYDNVGSVYIIYGKADTTEVDLIDVGNGTGGMVIDGVLVDEVLTGFSASSAGDVNGDGIEDFLIGAPYADAHGTDSGVAYVVFGDALSADSYFSLEDLEADVVYGGFAIHGVTPGELAGRSVSAAGDVNGDGLDDVIIGASSDSLARGAAYVVFGKTNTDMIHLDEIAAGDGGYVIQSADSAGVSTDQFGFSVAGIGDFNGDGLDDVLIGAPLATGDDIGTGAAYIVFGKADGEAIDLSSPDSSGAAIFIQGDQINAFAGRSVSVAGDVNGDGMTDLIIGASNSSNAIFDEGAAYVVFGREDASTIHMSDVRAGIGGFAIKGQVPMDGTGYWVSGGGDVNGDGFDDMVVAVPYSDTNGGDSGGAIVVFGANFTGAVNQVGDANANRITGTSADEVLFGAQGNDTLTGGGGNDRLSGGAGADRFVVTDVTGVTTLIDFDGDAGDKLDLSDFGLADFAAVQAKMALQHGSAWITLDDNSTVVLSGLDPDVLQASHVIL